MTRLHLRRLSGVVATAAAVVGFLLGAPSSLGGSAVWVSTVGDSMQPRIDPGDLVIARPAADYQVGDVVAYRSHSLGGAVVLHRIVAEKAEGLVTRGDGNDWLDQDRLPPSQVLGEMWLHIPGGGRMLKIFEDPFVIASLAFTLLTVGGLFTLRRSRRRGTRRAQGHGGEVRPLLTPPDAQAGAAAGTAVLAVALAFLAFGQPTTQTVRDRVEVTHNADLGYSADATGTQVYPEGELRTGDPVFLAISPVLDTTLRYTLSPGGDVRGTIHTRARVSASNGWEHTVEVGSPTRFEGSHAKHEVPVDLGSLRRVVDAAEEGAGTTFGGYTLEVIHDVRVIGDVAGESIDTTHQPKLTFALDGVQAVLQGAPASSSGPVTSSQTDDVAVPGTATATVGLMGWQMPVAALRGVALALALLSLALAATWMRQRGAPTSAALWFGRRLVSATHVELSGRPVVDVAEPAALRRVATLYDTVVVQTAGPVGRAFTVSAENTVYRYIDPYDGRLVGTIEGPSPARTPTAAP